MDNYVEQAEKVIISLKKDREGRPNLQYGQIAITSSQIRKLLSAVTLLNNQIELLQMQGKLDEQYRQKFIDEIRYLIVKFAYQEGRAKKGELEFYKNAGLIDRLKKIENNIDQFKEFARYMEALVAFHKYYGGKD